LPHLIPFKLLVAVVNRHIQLPELTRLLCLMTLQALALFALAVEVVRLALLVVGYMVLARVVALVTSITTQ
jgi:hypothetical protein